VLVHVDDCTIASSHEIIRELKERIVKEFSIKDLGALGANEDGSPTLLLGMEVRRLEDEFQLRQDKLVEQIVAKAGNEITSIPHEKVPIRDIRLSAADSPSSPEDRAKWKTRPYRQYIGAIGYLVLATMPHLAYAYKELSRFNDSFGKTHWEALMRCVAFLKKNKERNYFSISKHGGMVLRAFCDSDWNGSDTCLSTTGWVVFFGDTAISWVSRMQRATSRSTGEAEFIALSSCAQECVYLSMFVQSLRIPQSIVEVYCNDVSRYEKEAKAPKHLYKTAVKIFEAPVEVNSDSKVALAQAQKPDFWVVDKLRHIRTAYFFFKSYVRSGNLALRSVDGNKNCSDVLTKGFGHPGTTAANQKAEYYWFHADRLLGRGHAANVKS
jgi:hypothetical protein